MFKSKAKRLFGAGKQRRQRTNQSELEQGEVEQQATISKQEYFDFKTCHRSYSCAHCRAHLADHDQLISKLFQGNHGRAYLFNKVVNIGCKQAVQRELLTGLHAVADIYCDSCETTLGWKYEQAFVPSQKYKEGKYIIELVHMLKENNWDLTSYNACELIREARLSCALSNAYQHYPYISPASNGAPTSDIPIDDRPRLAINGQLVEMRASVTQLVDDRPANETNDNTPESRTTTKQNPPADSATYIHINETLTTSININVVDMQQLERTDSIEMIERHALVELMVAGGEGATGNLLSITANKHSEDSLCSASERSSSSTSSALVIINSDEITNSKSAPIQVSGSCSESTN